MSDEKQIPAPDVAPPTTNEEALAAVVDDHGARQSATEWAEAELVNGRLFDDVSADLLTQGWDEEQAAAIVERARESTRAARGVRTRDDVLVAASRRYRKSLTRIRWLVFLVIVVLAAGWWVLSKQMR